MKRPTMADIAREAGVSKGAVSYALNGRAGVSDETRRRILAIADQLGFRANSAARALAGAQAKVVGLALPRPPATLGVEPFFMELISGLEAELSTRSYALLLQTVPDETGEIGLYRRWWSESRVDGVLVCDLRVHDQRVTILRELGLPAVVIGPPSSAGGLASIWSDDQISMTEAVEYLVALGHRRIARVGGIPRLAHTAIRTRAFGEACERLGITEATTVSTDYTGENGAQVTRALLCRQARPTALVYDNDIMAIAGLGVAHELGLRVPADLSIVAWDDSPLCRLVGPPLTALSRDISAHGVQAARMLLSAMEGSPVEDVHDEPAHLSPRGSTAPPPQGSRP
ncbi:LacI family transcriptional regulator [Sphaerisporangium album]|uniref:LacI family transcriptional regulator n=1 Tax=Sphaerisporangium album TaxID=509200 RepID=A0A367FHP8_9ACTN|nr:LacI family DNA-binding transcriptional regulator [Sphaerisporangium album]RCG29903.1 LacI family transcriptional regulator [Sphaerisporangium album]